jgi:molybdopterin-guanine dinucleotide biosynthesis protein A
LAGGTASRFDGAPKGLELIGGERILDRLIRTLRTATGESPLLIANAAGAADWHSELEVVGDAIRDCGSLGGLYTALTVEEGPVIVTAWDMPFVPVELLEELVQRYEGHDVCIPENEEPTRRLEPLCAVYGPNCIDPVRKQIVDEDFRMTRFLKSVDVVTLPFEEVSKYGDPATIFFNVNTPDDLNEAQELWRGQHD